MLKIKLILVTFCSSILIFNSYSMEEDKATFTQRNVAIIRKMKQESEARITELNQLIANTPEEDTEYKNLIKQRKCHTDRIARFNNNEQVAKLIA